MYYMTEPKKEDGVATTSYGTVEQILKQFWEARENIDKAGIKWWQESGK